MPDLVVYGFLKRVYPDIDLNKPIRQLRAIYWNTIRIIQKERRRDNE